ncbi:hypothetical protein [Streptomyces sp. NBC_01751]|uniref:hypothetical protein n=1 Tax=Streptomyces sp. NBC_01751 TaxID=2975929 RepID=UPI002DD952D4|nr:hypothetical protein [Streptomyces sp. NBC_01751]WSD24583.1 hypothetical protein OHA26_14410 [Streptomyces sp. NBC_01751]
MSTVSVDLPWYAKLVFKAGRPVVLVAALLMSIPGEIHLAEVAGWDHVSIWGHSFNVAALMPVCVSVYAACSAVIADVAKRLKLPNRKSALIGAGAALALALAAQDISHLIALDYMGAGKLLVAAVSAIPPLVAAHMLHMAAAPAATASVHEVVEEDQEDEFEDEADEDGTVAKLGKRRGRPGLTEAEVQSAIQQLQDAGETVTPQNLGQILNRAPRTARRYLAAMQRAQKAAEKKAAQAQQSADDMLPLSI